MHTIYCKKNDVKIIEIIDFDIYVVVKGDSTDKAN